MTDDDIKRWERAMDQARKHPGGYITIPSGAVLAMESILNSAIMIVDRAEAEAATEGGPPKDEEREMPR